MQSVLTDCPDREKGPYTGDNVQDIQTELTLFDMQAVREPARPQHADVAAPATRSAADRPG